MKRWELLSHKLLPKFKQTFRSLFHALTKINFRFAQINVCLSSNDLNLNNKKMPLLSLISNRSIFPHLSYHVLNGGDPGGAF